MAMEESKDTKMKTFIIQEKFVGYEMDITITQKPKMKQSHSTIVDTYRDSDYDLDDMTYDHEFSDMEETDYN